MRPYHCFFLVFFIYFSGLLCPLIVESHGDDRTSGQFLVLEEYPPYRLEWPWLKSQDIAEIQEFLKDLSHYGGELDGIYGPSTAQGVESFRQEMGLIEGNNVDREFYLAMSQVYEEKFIKQGEKVNLKGGEKFVVIVLSELTLYLLENNTVVTKFPVAIGKASTPSPIGEWTIINRGAKEKSQFGSRWLGLNVPWGVYGIHGTNRPYSIGTMASAGCIRMFNRDVEKLYALVKEGTKVFIINEPFGVLSRGLKDLNLGARGSDVLMVQRRLRQLGFYQKEPDGLFDWYTHQVLVAYQRKLGKKEDGIFKPTMWEELGLFPFE